MVAALTGSDALRAQTPATNQRVWIGTWEEHDSWEGSHVFGRSQAQFSLIYVQGLDEYGTPRFESRRLTWSALWEDHRFDHVWVEEYGEADERGITSNRSRVDIVTVCNGGGTLELGPALAGSGDELTPEQKEQLRPSCITTYRQREAGPTPPPTESKRDALDPPGMPHELELTGCAYEKSWPGHPSGSFSVTVSAPLAGVMEVDPDPTGTYGSFVPVPGESLTFEASVPSGTARFRFELDPQATSTFPGYATNAYIDALFFAKHPKVKHLNERYDDAHPDLIFDPAQFPASQWSRAEFLVVETAQPQSAAVVTVTAMDYGAVGKLRAFVKSEGCGDWQPVPVRFGNETRESVSIPLDENDNLMADALEDYRSLPPGADFDADPKGNGTIGDGLTAFEEYRGFMIRGADCGESDTALQEIGAVPSAVPGSSQEHVRTPPHHKNVFVFADDPLLATFVGEFGWASNLSALAICEAGYGSNDFRIVNFTLHEAMRGRIWMGHPIILEEPQHGLWLKRVDETSVPGQLGYAVGVRPDVMGPPKLTTRVEIAKALFDPGCRVACNPGTQDLMITVHHELGHAIGIPHHGDDVVDWRLVLGLLDINPGLSPHQRAGGPPDLTSSVESSDVPEALLVDPGPSCTEDDDKAAFSDEAATKFVGCLAANIVRRGQQHSGDHWCPMRYPNGDRYEAPGTAVRYLWSGIANKLIITSGWTRSREVQPVKVDAWGGRVLRYEDGIDNLNPPLRRFCTKPLGTGINAFPGDRNHAGDNGRRKSCSEFVVVKDAAAPGTS